MGVPQRERYSAFPLAVRVWRSITATGRCATLSPRGSVPRVRRRGNQSGKKLNITPEESERLCAKPGISLRRSQNFGPFGLAVPSSIQPSSLPLEIPPKKKKSRSGRLN